jgi:hypothetical protein
MQNIEVAIDEPVKKRRGRKPKDVAKVVESIADGQKVSILDSMNKCNVASVATTSTSTSTSIPVEETVVATVATADDAPVKKGRRGRKPKYVYGLFDINNATEDSMGAGMVNATDDENVIVRLNISETEQIRAQEEISNDEEQPYAYNHDTYSNIPNIDVDDKPAPCIEKKNEGVKVISILKDFEEKNKHNEWPMSTSISCYWCCHRFNNAPFGIPINYINDTFEVFGCFCSLECAAAYNFSENTCQDEMWERYQLINMLNRRLKLGKVVKAAPPRLSLKMFGGHMEIEQFRGFTPANKFVNINFPPMTSVTQQLEEINDFELCNDFKYIPIDNERVNKYKEKIAFKRNKPLVDTNKSLESTMNLKYS